MRRPLFAIAYCSVIASEDFSPSRGICAVALAPANHGSLHSGLKPLGRDDKEKAEQRKLNAAMGKFSQTIKGYIWWTYPRGGVHYDVMVTIILAFIFLTPLWVNFRDKPQERPPRQTEVVVQQVNDGFLYKVDASAVKADSDADIRESLQRIIEPVAGEITIDRYEAVRDSKHEVVAYEVWGHR